MRYIVLLLLIATTAAAAQDSAPASIVYMLRVWDSQVSLRPTAGPNNVTNCILVLPDGRMQLQLLRQEFSGEATLTTYQATMSDAEMRILRTLLDAPSLKGLSNFVQPDLPIKAFAGGFIASIRRGSAVQAVGYVIAKDEAQTDSKAATTAWKQAQIVLQPIVEWSRAAKTYKHEIHWQLVSRPIANCFEQR